MNVQQSEAAETALVELAGKLSLETKVRLLSGAGAWRTQAVPEIGLAPVSVSDGPIGVRGVRFAEDDHSAAFPSPTAMAATWDDALLYRVGVALAGEAARKDIDVVLGPTINLHRSPLGGRHFECFSEDPYLTGRLATAYVRGLQDNGVGACPKHYVTNDAETDRTTVDNRVDERTLHELYLAPFEAVVSDARPWMVMSAYNGTNGAPMSENPLLEEPLKGSWRWDGAVVSDWGGVYSTVASARAAVDLAMPGPEAKWGEPLLEAVRSGEVDEAVIDAKVVRLLRLAARAGRLNGFDQPVATRVAAPISEAAALAREVAVASTVLLRNDGLLPLDVGSLRRVAVIGSNAVYPRALGGGSATVFPPYISHPASALRAALGNAVEVVTAVGAGSSDRLRSATAEELSGTVLRWLNAEGELVHEQDSPTASLLRGRGSRPTHAVSVEIHTKLRPASSGQWRVGVEGIGAFELDVNGATLLKEALGDAASSFLAPDRPQAWVDLPLEQGAKVPVVVRYRWHEEHLLFASGLVVREPASSDEEELARAAAVAAAADVAIVVVGTSAEVESEGFDRKDLRLPGRQDELVAAVAAANPRTVVVVNAGAPVEMPWRDDVAAVLVNWFPGMEMGSALADVLLGAQEPGGRLPTTWPAVIDDVPVLNTTPTDGKLRYDEGLHIGHRAYLKAGTTPAYWFGHGLGYTTWSYDALEADATTARVRIRNTGSRRGRDVVQVYTARPDSALDRPALVLSGYAAVEADPGEQVVVEVALDPRTLRHWDVASSSWQVEPGALVVNAGANAGSLALRADTTINS